MALIDRNGAEVLIPEEASQEILQAVPQNSVTMGMMYRLPDMTSNTRVLPVLSNLPLAYFVNGDSGFKKTASLSWKGVKIHAEEIAVIIPIPENVLADSEYDIWAQVQPRIIEAIGATWDAAVLHGTNAPSTFPDGIVSGAVTAGNYVDLDTSVSLYQQLLGENGVIAKVEGDGYMPNGYIGAIAMRSKMRGTVDGNGLPIFGQAAYRDGVGLTKTRYQLDATDIVFPPADVMDPSKALLIGGDWRQAVWAMRQDITTKLLTEAVIQDPATQEIVLNLAQQDCVALRVTFRAGWALPNPTNRQNAIEASRYPFAVLRPQQ